MITKNDVLNNSGGFPPLYINDDIIDDESSNQLKKREFENTKNTKNLVSIHDILKQRKELIPFLTDGVPDSSEDGYVSRLKTKVSIKKKPVKKKSIKKKSIKKSKPAKKKPVKKKPVKKKPVKKKSTKKKSKPAKKKPSKKFQK
jgi:hypothetical protein